jgi:hypothetical protein
MSGHDETEVLRLEDEAIRLADELAELREHGAGTPGVRREIVRLEQAVIRADARAKAMRNEMRETR